MGEVANVRVSKGKWLYFDLKDETSSVKCFATVFNVQVEEGTVIEAVGLPRLHNQYGFSFVVSSVRAHGQGSIKTAQQRLYEQLAKEGLFAPERKRRIPYPPERVVLVTSRGSAAEADFLKVLRERWPLLAPERLDVLVQGQDAPTAIVAALESIQPEQADVAVLTRGGGSPDDLAAFSDERVVRAVIDCRVPVLAAVGHEVDVSLAELAADARASTPSNAAELLVPEQKHALQQLESNKSQLDSLLSAIFARASDTLVQQRTDITRSTMQVVGNAKRALTQQGELLAAYDPHAVLQRGFALVRQQGSTIRSKGLFEHDVPTTITFADGDVQLKPKELD